MDWVVATFDKGTTAEQRQALGEILGHVFPVKWKSFQTAEGDIDTWTFDKDQAHATLKGGKTAEIKLKRFQGITDDPAVPEEREVLGHPAQRWFRDDAQRIGDIQRRPQGLRIQRNERLHAHLRHDVKRRARVERLFDGLLTSVSTCGLIGQNPSDAFFCVRVGRSAYLFRRLPTSPAEFHRAHNPLALFHVNQLIGLDVLHRIYLSAGPANLEQLHLLSFAHAKVDS
jgi:hypothetical protein